MLRVGRWENVERGQAGKCLEGEGGKMLRGGRWENVERVTVGKC